MSETDPETKNTGQFSSRRSLLTKLWALLGFVALAELLGMVFTFLKPRPKMTRAGIQDPVIIAGPVDSFLPGTVTAFVRGKFSFKP